VAGHTILAMNRLISAILPLFLTMLATPPPVSGPVSARSAAVQPREDHGGNEATQVAVPEEQGGGQQPEASSQQQPFRDEVEEGVKHVLVSQVEAWNRGNLQAYMNGYWRSPDLVFFSGATVTRGWQPTLERYQQRYASAGKEMGKLEFSELHIEVLSRRAAVVTGHWQLTMSDGKLPHGLFTLLFRKMDSGWKIVHDHSSGE
jgi:ketosteroid isomerase-like protein